MNDGKRFIAILWILISGAGAAVAPYALGSGFDQPIRSLLHDHGFMEEVSAKLELDTAQIREGKDTFILDDSSMSREIPTKSAEAKSFERQMDRFLENGHDVELLATALAATFKSKISSDDENRANPEPDDSVEEYEDRRISMRQSGFSSLVSDSDYLCGPNDAEHELVLFCNFENFDCKWTAQDIRELVNEHPGKIRYVLKHFPRWDEPHSLLSSMAAMAAGENSKFCEMSDALYLNRDNLTNDQFTALAAELGINQTEFRKQLASHKQSYWAKINADMQLAAELGINKIPTVVADGKILELVPSKKQLEKLLKPELEN